MNHLEATDLVELVKTAAVSVESRGRGPVIFFFKNEPAAPRLLDSMKTEEHLSSTV